MIDIENVKLPIWVWHYYPSGNAIEIVHLVKRLKNDILMGSALHHLNGFVIDKFYFMRPNSEFSVEDKRANILDSDIVKYNTMSTFAEFHEAIITIFSAAYKQNSSTKS